MPEVLDWQTVADPHAVIRHAANALRAGRLVAFPTETTYTLVASGLVPEATARLRTATGEAEPLSLAVRGAAEARDWVPGMSRLGQRLARRFWPGPLELAFADGIEEGLLSRLSPDVRRQVCADGTLHLRSPAHETILGVLQYLPGPLILAPVPAEDQAAPGAVDADQALRVLGDRVDLVVDDGPSHYRQVATVIQVNGNAWDILQPGVVSPDLVRQQSACMIVFICTGNTCRSPLAEALCKKQLAERLGWAPTDLPARGFYVLSAGLAAMMGGPAAAEAVDVARGYGAELAGHRSQPLTADLVSQADYLVAMTADHVQALIEQFARLGTRPRLLDPAGEDLPDPIGHPQPVYEECARQIWRHLEPLVAEIQSEALPVSEPGTPEASASGGGEEGVG
jgi:protein-tyrosine phosphatase